MAELKINSDLLLKYIYPVGSIYMSTVNSSPASFLGGTWERIQDRFLFGVVDSDSTYAAGKEGGAHTNTHNHYQTLSFDGTVVYIANSGATPRSMVTSCNRITPWTGGYGQGVTRQDSTYNEEINIMPPYLCVYIWKRIS